MTSSGDYGRCYPRIMEAKASECTAHQYLSQKRLVPVGLKVDEHGNLLVPGTNGVASKCLTRLIAGGLETEDAKAFLESMPTAKQLLPPVCCGYDQKSRRRVRRAAGEKSATLQ